MAYNRFSKNPVENAKSMKEKPYTDSVKGGPPASEYARSNSKEEGPRQPMKPAR
jgi:hypothetical protein